MKSNKQEIIDAINSLSEIDLAILRERILTVTEITLNSKEEIQEQLKNGFIPPDTYLASCQNIFDAFNFKDEQK